MANASAVRSRRPIDKNSLVTLLAVSRHGTSRRPASGTTLRQMAKRPRAPQAARRHRDGEPSGYALWQDAEPIAHDLARPAAVLSSLVAERSPITAAW